MKKVRIAINGFGRIGRLVLRAALESNRRDLEFVAINDLAPISQNAHLLQYDSVHGKLPMDVKTDGDYNAPGYLPPQTGHVCTWVRGQNGCWCRHRPRVRIKQSYSV